MLTCEKCGYDNELGRIFCHQCGAKLDLSSVKPPSQGGKRFATKKKPRSRVNTGGVLMAIGIMAMTLWMINRAIQKPELETIDVTATELADAQKKRRAIDQTLLKRQPAKFTVTGRELTAYFKGLSTEPAEGGGVRFDFSELQFKVGERDVTAILIGDLRAGSSWKHTLYLQYSGMPDIERGQFTFMPVSGHVGRLPIHPILLRNTPILSRFYAGMFENLTREITIVNSLSSIQVNNGVIEVSYQP